MISLGKVLRSFAVCFAALGANVASGQISDDTVYIRFHGAQIFFLNAKVTSVSSGVAMGNVAAVSPGASITVEADYVILFSANPADYTFCPSCVIQNYVGWLPEAVAAGASPVNLGLWDGQSIAPGNTLTFQGATAGHFVFTTSAPTTPGEYYIGCGETLDFDFVPSAPGAGGYSTTIGVVGDPDFASFLISVQTAPPEACPGNANGDGIVNFDDINAVIANWLLTCP